MRMPFLTSRDAVFLALSLVNLNNACRDESVKNGLSTDSNFAIFLFAIAHYDLN